MYFSSTFDLPGNRFKWGSNIETFLRHTPLIITITQDTIHFPRPWKILYVPIIKIYMVSISHQGKQKKKHQLEMWCWRQRLLENWIYIYPLILQQYYYCPDLFNMPWAIKMCSGWIGTGSLQFPMQIQKTSHYHFRSQDYPDLCNFKLLFSRGGLERCKCTWYLLL